MPDSRPPGISILARWRRFRRDIFASQPERLYRAQMAELRAPRYRSFTVVQPEVARHVLAEADAFPKSRVLARTLAPLLGRSVFVTNGPEWARGRAIIDPAFSGGRVRQMLPRMREAGERMLQGIAPGVVEVEELTARVTADVILRAMFSRPIDDALAGEVFETFRAYQRVQPLASPIDVMRLPDWLPRRRRGQREAARLRQVMARMLAARTGDEEDMIARLGALSPEALLDNAVMFLLAGHETSASALSWALLCLALDPATQDRVVAEVGTGEIPDFRQLPFTRDVWREVLRLYPPVPMLPRESAASTSLRDRPVRPGDPVILSPWHTGRSERVWDDPHAFDPDRWSRAVPSEAWFPFSAGPRICPGAGFATAEGVLFLAMIVQKWRVEPIEGDLPRPVAHLTVRSADGIRLRFTERVA